MYDDDVISRYDDVIITLDSDDDVILTLDYHGRTKIGGHYVLGGHNVLKFTNAQYKEFIFNSKLAFRSIGNAPIRLQLCKLKRHRQIYLCKIILASEKYKIIKFNEEAIGQCKKREIDLGQPEEEIFKRSMLSCYPVKWDDEMYNLTSTGETNQGSLYLYIWPKSYDGSPRPRPRLVAKIVFTDDEMDELQRLQDDGSSSYTGGLSTIHDEGGSSSSVAWPTINYEPDE
ncbi:hypothetical protein V9T40_012707 [Parthenolecanium corni]|uniref:Uncharacterized protein n=1 Tax=Parthenolecanium corni TaxID=536013 RepID=A0AAN9XZD5_9HEMI